MSIFIGREGSTGENAIRNERKDRVNSVSPEASRNVSTIQGEGGKTLGCRRKVRGLSEDSGGF